MEPVTVTSKPVENSPSGFLSTLDWKSIGKGFLIGLGGAVLTYILGQIQAIKPEMFGAYAPLATAVLSVVVNIIRKWISNTQNVVVK